METDYLNEDELRWYVPAIGQLLGMWLGEPAIGKRGCFVVNFLYEKYMNQPGKTMNDEGLHYFFGEHRGELFCTFTGSRRLCFYCR